MAKAKGKAKGKGGKARKAAKPTKPVKAAKADKKGKSVAKAAAKATPGKKAPAKKAAAKPAASVKAGKVKAPVKVKSASKLAEAKTPRYHTVTPYLNVNDAAAALDFYKKALGATERARMPTPDGRIMHAELMIGDSCVMLADAIRDPETQSVLMLYVDDCDAVFASIVSAGATALMPPTDMFWGDRMGRVTDPFGNRWTIATHTEDVPADEMERRAAAAGAAMPANP